jgi:CRISPR/Cas system-associated exonuclease Cas4 (RecB family)
MIRLSYTSSKFLDCPRRFILYNETKAVMPRPEYEYGINEHKRWEDNILLGIANTPFEEEVLNLAKKYECLEVEKHFEKEIDEDLKIVGFVDVFLRDTHDNVAIIEFKTGKWEEKQLYYYGYLVERDVKAYVVQTTKEEIYEYDIQYDDAKAIVEKDIEKAKMIFANQNSKQIVRPNPSICFDCPFTKNCPAMAEIDIVTQDNLPQVLTVMNIIEQRIKWIKSQLKEVVKERGELIAGDFKVYLAETPSYRLQIDKKQFLKKIIQDGKLELLDIKTKDAVQEYPFWFQEYSRKTLKIEENK